MWHTFLKFASVRSLFSGTVTKLMCNVCKSGCTLFPPADYAIFATCWPQAMTLAIVGNAEVATSPQQDLWIKRRGGGQLLGLGMMKLLKFLDHKGPSKNLFVKNYHFHTHLFSQPSQADEVSFILYTVHCFNDLWLPQLFISWCNHILDQLEVYSRMIKTLAYDYWELAGDNFLLHITTLIVKKGTHTHTHTQSDYQLCF